MVGLYVHVPVLCETIASLLVQNPSGTYIDGTIGGGGHTAAILTRLTPDGRVIGIDRDPAALSEVAQRFRSEQARLEAIPGDFRELAHLLDRRRISLVDGIILDLGVSSYQIDTPERGFSYLHDGPLDMRMNPASEQTAGDLLNKASGEMLESIIVSYGEERMARPIVRAILLERRRKPIATTRQLVEIIKRVVRHRPLYKTCARVFQALRIAVNDELDGLNACLSDAIPLLKPAGRFGVISYHSLEDRAVKQAFQRYVKGCICPPELPQCVCGRQPAVRLVNRRPLYPDVDEIRVNPRARSAKFRMVERLSDSSSSNQTT